MGITQYSSAVGNTLEQYVPLPLDQLFKAGQAIQTRGDAAQLQNDTIQTGLASMEALAPTHRDFVNKFVDSFKNQQGALLDKYHGNTSDPDYEREARRLNMQYAADPKLQIIKQANDKIKAKEAIKDKLASQGIKFLDSNPTYTGTDSSNNLTANVGEIRATDFDNQIDQAFKSKEGAIEQVGTKLTNTRNLHREYATLLNGMNNGTDSRMMEGLQYYKQKGYSDEQAKAQMIQHLNAGLAYTHDLKDHFYEEMAFKERELAAKTPPPAAVQPFQLLNFSKPIVQGKGGVDEDITNPNSATYTQAQQVLKNLDGDNLKTTERLVDLTPENLKAYPNAQKVYKSYLGDQGMGDTSPNSLKIKGYEPAEANLLATARKMLGTTGGTAKNVISKYADLIKSFDTSSQSITSTDNKKLNDITADVARRQIATGEVYQNNKGRLEKVKDPSQISEINGDNVSGISPKTLGDLNGYTQFTDKKGKVYYTPLPKEYQQQFVGSKVVENYIQDFDSSKLKEIPANLEGKNVNIFIDPNDKGMPYVFSGIQGVLSPYKATQNGKLVGGGLFTYKDRDGNQQTAPIPLSTIENNEKTSLFIKTANNNKVQGN